MKLGIISDTHGAFSEKFISELKKCDYIIHAGDFATKANYESFEKIGVPMYAVKGNTDKGEWASYLPVNLTVPFMGKLFTVVHNRADLPFDLTDIDFVIFGHTHHYEYYERFGKVFLNPGSAGDGRGGPESFVILELENEEYKVLRRIL